MKSVISRCSGFGFGVAPPVGAWIEIVVIPRLAAIGVTVAPPVGAWIEMNCSSEHIATGYGRSPRGSVD